MMMMWWPLYMHAVWMGSLGLWCACEPEAQ